MTETLIVGIWRVTIAEEPWGRGGITIEWTDPRGSIQEWKPIGMRFDKAEISDLVYALKRMTSKE